MSETEGAYAKAGVKYDEIDPFKKMAQAAAKQTAGNLWDLNQGAELNQGVEEVMLSRGESAYIIRHRDHYLVHVEEGLGTKNLVADAMYCHAGKSYYDSIAQCAVAMIVNDMATVGARPLSVSMHLAVGSSDWFSDEQRSRDLIAGWKTACDLSRAVWGGGETPVLKGCVEPGRAVLSGSAMGVIDNNSRMILGRSIRQGDIIMLVESSGIHANGLTLARKIADDLPEGYLSRLSDGRLYGEALLDPTRIYCSLVNDALDAHADISYAVNITGHGWRKLMRLPGNFCYRISELPAQRPIFDFIQKQGRLSEREMYETFNMGAGFALYVRDEYSALAVVRAAQSSGFRAFRAGVVEMCDEKKVVIEPNDLVFKGDSLDIR